VAQRKLSSSRAAEPYVVVVSADEDPERWLAERQKLITATDVPSVLGIPGARDALETWYQKKDELMSRAESAAIRDAKKSGHDFEDFNALMFSKRTGRYVERDQRLVRSARYPWLGATLDYRQQIDGGMRVTSGGFLLASSPLELKNVGSFAADEMWPLGGEPHLTWQLQLQTQMIVVAAKLGSLSAWIGSPFVHQRGQDFEHNADIEEIVVDETQRFWKSLSKATPPAALVNPKTALAILRRLSPATATRRVVSLPKVAAALDREIATLAKQHEASRLTTLGYKTALEQKQGEMAALIGAGDGGLLPSGDRWMFKHVHVPEHTVAAHSYRKLNRQSAASSKPRKTTWKTSK